MRLYTARQYNQRLNQFGDFEKPTEIDDPQILIDQFKHAALNAKKAGFDGIERKSFLVEKMCYLTHMLTINV